MYANMEALDNSNKNNAFDMENVEFGQTGLRPSTSIDTSKVDKQFQQTQAISVKQGGRRNKHRKTQEAFRSNVIEVVPNSKADPTVKKFENLNMLSFEEMNSNSP